MSVPAAAVALLVAIAPACHDDSPSAPDGPASETDAGASAISSCPDEWVRPFPVAAIDYPFTSRCVELAHGPVHYFDESPTDSAPRGTVLAVHGNPTWSFLYRKVAAQLLDRGFRVIALDLYGFGMSAKPPLAEFDYRASSHAATVDAFVTALDLTDVLLVAQDWGGPVGLGMAVRQPERVSGLILLNTWSWEIERIPSGTTSVMHTVHDWGVESIVNAPYYDATMQTAHRAGHGL
ncbi:MAG: alpha/beta fold hydrolase, partial [Myxococcota bacterium]